MMKGQTMKLRNMSAYVTEEKNITIELVSGEVLNLENALVLRSYSSRVAVYCKMRVYLLLAMITASPRGSTFTRLSKIIVVSFVTVTRAKCAR